MIHVVVEANSEEDDVKDAKITKSFIKHLFGEKNLKGNEVLNKHELQI